MVKTTLVKLKDDKGQEYATIFGDLTELYSQIEETIDNAEKISDLAEGLFAMKKYLAKLIQDSISQYETTKKSEVANETNPVSSEA